MPYHIAECLQPSTRIIRKEEADWNEFYQVSENDRSAIILQNEMVEEQALIKDGVCYFDLATVHKYLNEVFYADKTENLLLYATPTEVIRTKERNQILHLCMGELHPDYREALYLTYFEGMSYRQVAEVMGKSVKQITNIMYRGKERLRGLLEREGITNAES